MRKAARQKALLLKAKQRKALPPKAKILCDGDEWFWVHVASDLSEVNIDSSELDYAYDDDEET